MLRTQRSAPQRKRPDARPEGTGAAEAADNLFAWIDTALGAVARDAPDSANDAADDPAPVQTPETSAYIRGFALGEALGRRFRAQCSARPGPHGLGLLVARLSAGRGDAALTPRAKARQAMLAGLCWDLENALIASSAGRRAEQPGHDA